MPVSREVRVAVDKVGDIIGSSGSLFEQTPEVVGVLLTGWLTMQNPDMTESEIVDWLGSFSAKVAAAYVLNQHALAAAEAVKRTKQ